MTPSATWHASGSLAGPIPLHHQVYLDLRSALDAGEWRVGDQLPPERELADRYGCSLITVRRALGDLARERRIERARGRGTFVSRRRSTSTSTARCRSPRRSSTWATTRHPRRDRKDRPRGGRRSPTRWGSPSAPPVVHVERLRMADGEPLLLEQVFLPEARFPGLLASDLERGSLYELLARRYDTAVVRAREALEPIALPDARGTAPGVEPHRPALLIEGLAFDRAGKPGRVRPFLRPGRPDALLRGADRRPLRREQRDGGNGPRRAAARGATPDSLTTAGRRRPGARPGGADASDPSLRRDGGPRPRRAVPAVAPQRQPHRAPPARRAPRAAASSAPARPSPPRPRRPARPRSAGTAASAAATRPEQVEAEKQVVEDFNATHPDIHLDLRGGSVRAARTTPWRPRSRRATGRTSSGRSASAARTRSTASGWTSRRSSRTPATTCPASPTTPSTSTSSTRARSASRSRSTRRSCSTCRACSRRPVSAAAPQVRRQVHDAGRLAGRLELRHGPRDREDPDRRQERQGRDPGRLRPQEHRPVGLRAPARRPPGHSARTSVPGSLAAADGKTAQIPDPWKTGWQFWYDSIWKDHIS